MTQKNTRDKYHWTDYSHGNSRVWARPVIDSTSLVKIVVASPVAERLTRYRVTVAAICVPKITKRAISRAVEDFNAGKAESRIVTEHLVQLGDTSIARNVVDVWLPKQANLDDFLEKHYLYNFSTFGNDLLSPNDAEGEEMYITYSVTLDDGFQFYCPIDLLTTVYESAPGFFRTVRCWEDCLVYMKELAYRQHPGKHKIVDFRPYHYSIPTFVFEKGWQVGEMAFDYVRLPWEYKEDVTQYIIAHDQDGQPRATIQQALDACCN